MNTAASASYVLKMFEEAKVGVMFGCFHMKQTFGELV